MKKRELNAYEIVVRGDKGFALQIFPPKGNNYCPDFDKAISMAKEFLIKCKSMSNENLRISKIQEIVI